jgi:hypothetical protein
MMKKPVCVASIRQSNGLPKRYMPGRAPFFGEPVQQITGWIIPKLAANKEKAASENPKRL